MISGGSRSAAATTRPSITTSRRSSPRHPLLDEHLRVLLPRPRHSRGQFVGTMLDGDADGDALALLSPSGFDDDFAHLVRNS